MSETVEMKSSPELIGIAKKIAANSSEEMDNIGVEYQDRVIAAAAAGAIGAAVEFACIADLDSSENIAALEKLKAYFGRILDITIDGIRDIEAQSELPEVTLH